MSKTTLVTQQVQLQEWFHMMQESKGRPQQIPLDEWCKENYGISAAGYYYRVRKVKEAYLDQVSEEKLQENLAIVPKELFHEDQGTKKSIKTSNHRFFPWYLSGWSSHSYLWKYGRTTSFPCAEEPEKCWMMQKIFKLFILCVVIQI